MYCVLCNYAVYVPMQVVQCSCTWFDSAAVIEKKVKVIS